MGTKTKSLMTVGDAAQRLGVRTWQLARLFERGIVPEPPRVGVYRAIAESDLPVLRKALVEAGYLKN